MYNHRRRANVTLRWSPEEAGGPVCTTKRFDGVSRRNFLQASVLAGAGATLQGAAAISPTAQAQSSGRNAFDEATIAQLQAAMAAGRTSAVELTNHYLNRIQAVDEHGPHLNSVIELNPDALALAVAADALRRRGRVLGPLHGIPILLEGQHRHRRPDADDGRLVRPGRHARRSSDSTVAAKLRAGGAVILGKTNLSEWANFRSFHSSSGWSGRGGQMQQPLRASIATPAARAPGSGAAVSANLCAVALGTETDGSIVCPASLSGVVGIKPTVGLTSRAGVVPISHTQDTVGPHARTVADAAAVLTVIASQTFDGRDAATGGVPLGRRGRRRPGRRSRPTTRSS